MLILSREKNESIRIGDDITVTILGEDRGRIKVGIDAPKGVAVHREEIYQRIQNDAAGVPDKDLQIELAYQQHWHALDGGDA